MKRLVCGIISLIMAAALFGCGGKEAFDAKTYVKGILDTAYRCEVDDYVKQTGVKKSEAREAHMEFAENSGLRLAAYFGIEPGEEVVIEYRDICERLYQSAGYGVTTVSETENGYEITVEFQQEKFIENVEKNIVDVQNKYQKALAEGREDAQKIYETGLLEAMDAYLENREFSAEEATIVIVENEDGGYAIDPVSLNEFHQKMFGF